MLTPPSATVIATHVHSFASALTGTTYQLSVALPYAYHDDPSQRDFFNPPLAAWPVIYLLDANWFFGMVTDFVRSAAWCGRSHDAIVVGIGYPAVAGSTAATWRNVYARRQLDLTPARDAKYEAEARDWHGLQAPTGGAGQFLACLQQELIPWVEQIYRADPAWRVLAGHSYGGLFALYALLEQPGLFRSYLAASPTLRFGDEFLFTHEAAFAETHTRLVAQVMLSAGDLEETESDPLVSDAARFAAQLARRQYVGLSVENVVFADTNHCESNAPAFQAGLKQALRPAT